MIKPAATIGIMAVKILYRRKLTKGKGIGGEMKKIHLEFTKSNKIILGFMQFMYQSIYSHDCKSFLCICFIEFCKKNFEFTCKKWNCPYNEMFEEILITHNRLIPDSA